MTCSPCFRNIRKQSTGDYLYKVNEPKDIRGTLNIDVPTRDNDKREGCMFTVVCDVEVQEQKGLDYFVAIISWRI
jgi:hypothetical protein